MLIGLFVDLKTAFDSLDRGILIETIKERGISERLIRRVVEVLRETKSRIKVGNDMGESFWTARGIRQGCPINFLLFSIILADIKEEMRKVKWGGIRLGEESIFPIICRRPSFDGEERRGDAKFDGKTVEISGKEKA